MDTASLTIGFGVVDQTSVIYAAVLAAMGILLIGAGWYGMVPSMRENHERLKTVGETGARIMGASGSAIFLFSISGWPVLTVFGAIGGWFGITLRNSRRERRAAIERVDGIAGWVEVLRDNISGGAGLQQALRSSGKHAPEAIRIEVRDLVLRLQHEAVVPALRQFARDVAHPTADMAVGSLILASTRSAGSLAAVLTHTASAARDSAAMMRHVESGRAASQSQAKLTAGMIGAIALFMITKSKEYVAPYDSTIGQIGLAVICLIATAAVVMLYRLSKLTQPSRVFQGVEIPGPSESPASESVGAV